MNTRMKNKIVCEHNICTMFYKCPSYKIYDHLHCIRCGIILTKDWLLSVLTEDELLNAIVIYESRCLCEQLTDHL